MTRKINFFFIHNTMMKEREVTMNQFRAGLAKYEFSNGLTLGKVATVESFDPSNIDMKIIQSTVNYAPIEDDSPFKKYNAFRKNLHVFQLSNDLKHVKVLEVVSQQSEDDINIILEDDVSFDPSNVYNLIEKAIAAYTKESIMFLGFPNDGQKREGAMNVLPTKQFFEIIPYNDSYMLDKEAAQKIYTNMIPIRFITNINLNLALEKSGVVSYQTVPNIFVDGSKIGIFTSSLVPNNVLMFNADYMKLREIATKRSLESQDKEIAEKILAGSPCAQHPDFQYMKAIYLEKTGDYNGAIETYKSAYDIYNKNLCIMNHESNFLKDYIKVHKHVQPVA